MVSVQEIPSSKQFYFGSFRLLTGFIFVIIGGYIFYNYTTTPQKLINITIQNIFQTQDHKNPYEHNFFIFYTTALWVLPYCLKKGIKKGKF